MYTAEQILSMDVTAQASHIQYLHTLDIHSIVVLRIRFTAEDVSAYQRLSLEIFSSTEA